MVTLILVLYIIEMNKRMKYIYILNVVWGTVGFPMAQTVKILPALQISGLEDPLEKEMATHSCILAWRISWTEEPGVLQSMELQRLGHG